MSQTLDIEALREQLARDQSIFRLQRARLTELENTPAEELNQSGRLAVMNWPRTHGSCVRQLDAMIESIPHPTAEERQIMRALDKLITQGDQMSHEAVRIAEVLEAKLGKVDLDPEIMPKGIKTTNGFLGKPKEAPLEPLLEPIKPESILAETITPGHGEAIPENGSNHVPARTQHIEDMGDVVNNAQEDLETTTEETDSETVYEKLGVSPDAPMAVIKK